MNMLRGRTRNQRMTDARKHKNADKRQTHRGPAIGPQVTAPQTVEVLGMAFTVAKDETFIPGLGPLVTVEVRMAGDKFPVRRLWFGTGATMDEALETVKLKIEHELA